MHPLASLHRHISPGEFIMFGISDDDKECLIAPGLSLNYFVWDNQCEISTSIDDRSDPQPNYPEAMRGANKLELNIYEHFLAKKDDIEESFGEFLDWRKNSSVHFYINGGYESPEQEWDEIICHQVSAMNRLYAAFLPHLDGMPGKHV